MIQVEEKIISYNFYVMETRCKNTVLSGNMRVAI